MTGDNLTLQSGLTASESVITNSLSITNDLPGRQAFL